MRGWIRKLPNWPVKSLRVLEGRPRHGSCGDVALALLVLPDAANWARRRSPDGEIESRL